jgi:hypothetical protein|tara:strand:+ start:507 stop:647 length:141 start_codon:yes stop_codon:yes gene_type:complete
MLPEEEVMKVFPPSEREVICSLIRNGKTKLEPLHKYLEKEVNALKY